MAKPGMSLNLTTEYVAQDAPGQPGGVVWLYLAGQKMQEEQQTTHSGNTSEGFEEAWMSIGANVPPEYRRRILEDVRGELERLQSAGKATPPCATKKIFCDK